MANGTYGSKKPAFITYNDVDIFYYYRPNRYSESDDFSSGFQKLDSNLLSTTDYSDTVLPGMYNLRLPLTTFSGVGIYTVYIKPKEIEATITDVSTLNTNSNIRGIVIDSSNYSDDSSIFNDGELVGYRVEYFNYDDSTKRSDIYRIITSNHKCEAISQNLNNLSTKSITYSFNKNSNLVFCTLTPSVSLSFESTSDTPYIGRSGQKIVLINTKFNPVMLEIEMTEHDIETISTMLEGTQLRNLKKGLITTFNSDGEIYHQSMVGNVEDSDDEFYHDFKIQNTTNIETTEADKLTDIKNNL